jgi:hypothetical protein
LPALLSQVLVALTIEIDNAYEDRAPHRTTGGGGDGPYLTSYAMWANGLRLVPAAGITARDLAACAGFAKSVHPAQAGLQRWGYLEVEPDPDDPRPRPPKPSWIVRLTEPGRVAASVWTGIPAEIEARWTDRFGAPLVGELRDRAADIVGLLELRLPAYLPQLAWPLRSEAPATDETVPGDPGLVTALANVLHAFAIEYERAWPVPLAAANVLRVVDRAGVRVRDIPRRAGVGKEAASWATGVLGHGFVEVVADPAASRGKLVRLTDAGARVQAAYPRRAADVEAGWSARFPDLVADLRDALEQVVEDDGGRTLRAALEAPAGCWRAKVRAPEVLPDCPMVLHRGGYPDGA